MTVQDLEQETARLGRKCRALLQDSDQPRRVVIGIAGVPGSGKTTLARLVCQNVNSFSAGDEMETPLAVALPMDGFHYTRAHLAAMPNSADAIHRRGAAFTFDADGFQALVRALTESPPRKVLAPSFDHGIKDPVVDEIVIAAESRIVLVEGNYCALDREPWKTTASLMTELWYVDTPAPVAHQRLAVRHLASGIVADEKEAWGRATGTDERNAQDIRTNRLACDEVLVLVR